MQSSSYHSADTWFKFFVSVFFFGFSFSLDGFWLCDYDL